MSDKFVSSSKRHPCPVCDRTKDGDCRSSEADNLILCHSHTSDPGELLQGYKFLHSSKDGLWGVFIFHQPDDRGKVKGRKPASQRPHRERYIYTDRTGENLVMVVRISTQGKAKTFAQYRWDGVEWQKGLNDYQKQNIPIYRYSDIRAAIAQGKPIFLVEGEAKADRLWSLGIPATTTIGGSKKYRSYGSYRDDLQGADLILCPDRDRVGMEHMEDVAKDFPAAKWCYVFPNSPLWRYLPDDGGLDIENWLDDGATVEDVMTAISDRREAATPSPSELDSPEGRKAKHDRILAEWERIGVIQESSLQHLERVLLSQREKLPLREVEIVGKRSRHNKPLVSISTKALCDQPDKNAGDLIESVLENGVSLLLFAQSKAGKTPLLYDMAYSVATGEAWMEQFKVPEPGGVLLLQSDETERASKKNFRRRGLHRLENVEFSKEFTIDDIPCLVKRIEELKKTINLKLVGVDSLTTINADNSFSENDAEFARDLYRLARAVTDTGVSLIVTHHRRKNGLMGDLDSASGSGRIVAAVDDVWALHRMLEKEDSTKLKRVLERVAAHDGDLFRWVIKLHLDDRAWELEGEYDAAQQEGDRVVGFIPPVPVPKSITQQIQEFLEQSGQRWEHRDLAETLNLNENTVRKVLAKLFEDGRIDRDKATYRNNGRYAQVYFAKTPLKGEVIRERSDSSQGRITSQTQTEKGDLEVIHDLKKNPQKTSGGDRAIVW